MKKQKNIAGDIIILHMCTKSHNHMKCSSWDTELDRLFCHFGPFFALLHPLTTHKIKILKSIWRCQHFKLVQQKTWSYDVCLLRYGVRQTIFCYFRPVFALLPHYWPQKLKFGKNVKNTCRYYPFTHVYHKSRYDVWFLKYKEQWTVFCHFGPFLSFDPPNNSKN